MLETLKAAFLIIHFSYYINDLPDYAICNIWVYDDTTLYSKCDQGTHLCQQLELASEFVSDLQGRSVLPSYLLKAPAIPSDATARGFVIDVEELRP